MIVLASDAPLDAGGLRRLAARAFGGLARTGAALSHGSGDYALAFSTAEAAEEVPGEALSELFEAAIEATEEAILNALCMAVPMAGYEVAKGRPFSVDALQLPARK